jgi:hypothetical protein
VGRGLNYHPAEEAEFAEKSKRNSFYREILDKPPRAHPKLRSRDIRMCKKREQSIKSFTGRSISKSPFSGRSCVEK